MNDRQRWLDKAKEITDSPSVPKLTEYCLALALLSEAVLSAQRDREVRRLLAIIAKGGFGP